jgi:hypothetical protein
MIKKTCYLILFLLAISGCTPRQQFIHHYDIMNSTPAFSISDKRPETEKTAEILSVNVMNENYGIFKIGDSQMTPDRIEYLISQLSVKANNQLAGGHVVVEHFEIHNNLQKILKRGAAFGAFGLAGGVIAGVTVNPDALIDINLALTIDQKTYGVHLVRGYNLPKGQGASDDLVAAEIYTAIDETIDRIVSEL